MTAVVGVLNKRAVAIAADSAVTTSSGKIFNKANKIFTLSKRHPIGIMIHNVDSFMGVPWEVIIKIYREQLKEKSFSKLNEYVTDFIGFLRLNNFFSDDTQQKLNVDRFCVGISHALYNEVVYRLGKFDLARIEEFNNELEKISKERGSEFNKFNILPEFSNYSIRDFTNYIDIRIDEIVKYPFETDGWVLSNSLKELLLRTYYSQLVVEEDLTKTNTGLTIVGYGESEIFPSLIPLTVFLGFEGKLRYFIGVNYIIDHDYGSQICTFAQSDVIFTILTGIAPDLQQIYNENVRSVLEEQYNALINGFTGDKTTLKDLLDKIDKDALVKKFTSIMDDVITRKFINPLHNAVSGLGKEDLAEMAESLIYLTYLQRRITNAEESVGGPVDVAVISKGDGFVWIKRKHYFTKELNPGFFDKYFK